MSRNNHKKSNSNRKKNKLSSPNKHNTKPNTRTSNNTGAVSTALGIGTGLVIGNWFFINIMKSHQLMHNYNIKYYSYQENMDLQCKEKIENFGSCLDENKTDISKCQFFYDILIKCADDENETHELN